MTDRERMRRAVAEVRREGLKAAFLYAVLDGAVVALAGLVLTGTLSVPGLDREVALGAASVRTGSLLAVLGGLLAGGLDLTIRARRPAVERFEAVNPEVHEALRTARDALERGEETPMARALYADVTDRLSATSSLGLLSVPRLAATVALAIGLSVAAVQLPAAGIALDPSGGNASVGTPVGDPGEPATPTGLQSGESLLGTPADVTPGSENLSARIAATGGRGEGSEEYEGSGAASDGTAVRAVRAGYAGGEEIENAELIKRYNLAIRRNTSE